MVVKPYFAVISLLIVNSINVLGKGIVFNVISLKERAERGRRRAFREKKEKSELLLNFMLKLIFQS